MKCYMDKVAMHISMREINTSSSAIIDFKMRHFFNGFISKPYITKPREKGLIFRKEDVVTLRLKLETHQHDLIEFPLWVDGV